VCCMQGGANLEVTNARFQTALLSAINRGHAPLIELLTLKGDVCFCIFNYKAIWPLSVGSRWPSVNTLVSDASGPGSTPRRGILKLDRGYHLFGVGEMCSN